jgi:outer membrane protein TolC
MLKKLNSAPAALIFTALLLLFANINLPAMELSEDEAVELALKENLSLQRGGIDLNMKERESASVWNRFLPDLYAGANLMRSESRMDDPLYGQFITEPWYFTTFVSMELNLSASTASNIKATRQEYEGGQIDYETAARALERDVRIQYNDLLITRETIGIYEQMVETALKNYERSKLNFELGNARKVDMLSYQVNYESQKPVLINAQNTFETKMLEFKRTIGLAPDDHVELLGSISQDVKAAEDGDALISRGLKSNLELQALRKQMEILKTRKQEAALGTRTPRFGISYSYNNSLYDPADADWGDDENWSDSASQLDLTLTLPLNGFIPNSEMNLQVRNLSDELKKMELLYKDASRQTGQVIREMILNINMLVKTIEVHRLSIELARENYAITEKSYFEGAADYLQVQSAQDNLNQAQINEKNAVLNYLSSRLYLDYMLNESQERK